MTGAETISKILEIHSIPKQLITYDDFPDFHSITTEVPNLVR
jgi:hypothetical protein